MSNRFVDFILFYCYHYAFTVFSSLVFSVTVITVCAQLFLSVIQSVIALAQKAKDEKLQLQLEDHRQLQQQQHSSLEHRGKDDATNITAVDSSTCCTASTTTASRILTISTAVESVVQENNDNRKQQQQEQQQQQQQSGQQHEVVNYALLGTIKVRTSSDALCELLSGYQESDNTTATTTCLESPIIMSPVNISPGSKRKQSFSPSSKHLQKISSSLSSSLLLSVTTGNNNRCCSKSNHDYDHDDDGNNYDDSRIEDSRIDHSINHIVDTHNCHDVNDYLNHNHFVSTNSVDNEDDEDYKEKVVDVIKEGKSKVENSIGAVLGLSSAADRGARIISPVLGKD